MSSKAALKPYRPANKYEVVAVRARPRDEAQMMDERIDVTRCHPAEQDKVIKIAKAYMEFGGYQSELKATATDGKGHTILSIMPWKGEFSAPMLAQTFHKKNNKSANVEYDSILDTRITPLTGEVRVIIQKTAQTALAEDRKVQPNPLYRASSRQLEEEEEPEALSEYEESAKSAEEPEPVDYGYYNHRPRPYIPKKR